MSQVPEFILANRLTKPPETVISHLRPKVDAFKSGEETSVNATPPVSHVE